MTYAARREFSRVNQEEVVETAQSDQSDSEKVNHVQSQQSPFRYDSTYTLLKKYFLYKVMASKFCIDYSLVGMSAAYRLLGVRLTNSVIERTAGSIFTGGVTLGDLKKEVSVLKERNIGVLGGYCVEDVDTSKESELIKFTDTILETIEGLTEHGAEGHFAVKLTAFIGIDDLRRLSLAQ